jgi:hypothetical protein
MVMNERILRLAKQSGLIQYESDGKMEEVDKFAELIVQEVLSVQEQLIAKGHNAWHMNKPTKEHFGVEE